MCNFVVILFGTYPGGHLKNRIEDLKGCFDTVWFWVDNQ
ncbi:Hypothetical protein I595_1167 [Croceitalea dokdonensis DOKDO 023]|uniref:Uncharacterized protein n=1 Tax=Croceitalea dokdonensis DOKDO 023 TaxID=1300341 RepID=A0A0N8H494_9FLAO|nr:Hypothetical protein I595_1167 [Croceitalea dokdonensis DOKDO 023]